MLWSSSTGLAISDRGLQYGDGLFETMLVVASQTPSMPAYVWLLAEHLKRLRHGCAKLGIHYPQALLEEQIAAALAHVDKGLAVLKLVVTAQASGTARGYARESVAQANLHCSLHPAESTPLQEFSPVRVRVTRTGLATQPALAGVKHLNRLEQVLACRELQADDFEGLMLNSQQGVVECTSSNVFAVIDGQLWTPPLEQCGVAGILRQHLQTQFRDALQLRTISLDQLRMAQEVFIANSVYGVRAVGELVAVDWVARYDPGPWYAQVKALLRGQIELLAQHGPGAAHHV